VIELASDLFVEEAFIRFYGVKLQTRMAVVRLSGQRLLLYSPIPLNPAIAQRLEELGTVACVVSPNKIHNQTLASYRAAYPQARLYVPPGLPERCPGLTVDAVLSSKPEAEWRDEMDHVLTGGNVFFSEALMFHRASGTLLVGDFIENFRRETSSETGRWLARAFGVAERPMASPEFRYYTFDANALVHSLAPIDGWALQRIFLCHGEMVTSDASRVFDSVRSELAATANRRRSVFRAALSALSRLQ